MKKEYHIFRQNTDVDPRSTIESVTNRKGDVILISDMVEDQTYIVMHEDRRIRFIEIREKANDCKWYTTVWDFHDFNWEGECDDLLKLFRSGLSVDDMIGYINL